MQITRYILFLMIGLTLGFGIGNRLTKASGQISFTENKNKEKLNRLIDFIEDDYVNEIDTDSLVDNTIKGILAKLDPHSTFIPSINAQAVAERMQGDFIGIGIKYYVTNDTLSVISTIPNGPSYKAGIVSGDRILNANLDTLYGKSFSTNENIQEKLRGTIGSTVKLKVLRPEKGISNYNIIRERVPITSVKASFLLNQNIGYIKLERFAETTYNEFKNSLKQLTEQGIKTLILDLRENGGGYVAPAIQIADEFLESNTLIMFTKDREKKVRKSYATSKGGFESGTVYVLMNENSASASEILAGALQDNDKGTIVGRRSFGKGLVQQERNLGDGSKIRLTVSKYYTPTGRSIQRPYNKGTQAYYQEYLERYNSGELQDSTKLKINDTLAFKTPKGKIVYGGGGIIPDVYISKNIERNLELLDFSLYSGVLSRFVFSELDTNRKFYNGLSKKELRELKISDNLLMEFKTYATNRGLEFRGSNENNFIRENIKAEIANQLFSENLGAQILSSQDKMIQKILELENRKN